MAQTQRQEGHLLGENASQRPKLVSVEPGLVSHEEVERGLDRDLRRGGVLGIVDDLRALARRIRQN